MKNKKQLKIFGIVVVLLVATLTVFFLIFTTKTHATSLIWQEKTSVGLGDWRTVAMSSDGVKMVAASGSYGGYIYTSTDSGATWVPQTNAGSHSWQALASSDDGTKLVAAGDGTHIFTSTDSGVNWIEQMSSPQQQWFSIMSSSDGSKLFGGGLMGYLYTSSDYGVTWSETYTHIARIWDGVTLSTDGNVMSAVATGRRVITNNGTTGWVDQANSGIRNWSSITANNTGTKIAATAVGIIYVSNDSGVTWSPKETTSSHLTQKVAYSADGTVLVAADYGGYIYMSYDDGDTWVTQTDAGQRNWNSLAVSADGTKVLAGVYSSGYIYVGSTDITPPVISSIASNTATSSVVITWDTDEAASSQIVYGITSAYGATTTLDSSLVTSHIQTILNLLPCTNYHYKVLSSDSVANTSFSDGHDFNTVGCTGDAAIISSDDANILVDSGGTFTLGGLVLQVPASFTSTTTSANFQAKFLNATTFSASVGAPTGLLLVGSEIVNLKAISGTSTVISSFLQPLEVTLSYSPSDISGIDEGSLVIYRYDGSVWTTLSSCSTNTTAHTVTCETSHFSDFALFGAASSGGGNPGGGSSGPITTSGAIPPEGAKPATAGTTTVPVVPVEQSQSPVQPIPSPITQEVIKFSKNLQYHDTGPNVAKLQQILSNEGFFDDEINGIFGPKTYIALVKYQKKYHIAPPSGFFGPITRGVVNGN